MPAYTDKEKSYQDLRKLQESEYRCAECGAALLLVWGGSYGYEGYVLRCAADYNHTGIGKKAELRPDQIPGFNLYNFGSKRRKNMEQKHGQEAMKALAKYQNTSVITKDMATEIVDTLWKGAPQADKAKAIMLCWQYNLNPLMKHLFLVKYKRYEDGKVVGEDWEVIRGIEATRLLAHRKHRYTYLDMTPRRATKEEIEKALGDAADQNYVYAITKIKDLDTGAEAYGLKGRKREEKVKGTEKGNTPLNMASIQSERQALDRLYPGEMPVDVEVGDERFIEGEYRVDESTGEIKEIEQRPTTEPATTQPTLAEGEATEINDSTRGNITPLKELDSEVAGLMEQFGWKKANLEAYAKEHGLKHTFGDMEKVRDYLKEKLG